MWILAFEGRQYWLLPGKRYIVGRNAKTRDAAVDIAIKESSVSRTHLALQVVPATDDAMSHPTVKSQLLVTDLGSRFGTRLDGRELAPHKETSVPFTATDRVSLRIGSAVTVQLKWKAFAVTYSTGQSGAEHAAMWSHAVSLLQPLDVKLVPYLVEGTSVLVKAGATTSTVYLALAACIPIVNSHFLQALHDAAMRASAAGTRGPITPDLTPYIPDPAWRPNAERRTCLAGQAFHCGYDAHAASVRPIIQATGGVYTDTPDANTLWVVKRAADLVHVPAGAAYIELLSVFSAISDCRGIAPGEIRRAEPEHTKHRSESEGPAPKKQRVSPESSSAAPSPATGRPRHARVNFFSALTSSQPPAASQPPSSPPSAVYSYSENEPTAEQRPRADAGAGAADAGAADAHADAAFTAGATGRAAAGPPRDITPEAPAQATARTHASKRTGNALDPPPRKRARRPPAAKDVRLSSPGVNASEPDPEPNDDDIAVSDYSKIGELAIVEASMDTVRPARTRASARPDWAGRADFKGFRRSQRGAAPRRVAYDADARDDAPMHDDFAAPAAPRSESSSLRTELRAGARMNRRLEDDSEESLFVSTDPEDDFGSGASRAASRRAGSSLVNELSTGSGDEDDGFSFRFS